MNWKDSAPRGWVTEAKNVVVDTYVNWREARTIRLGAGIAYYSLFAIIPFVTLSIALAELLVNQNDIEQLFYDVGEEYGVDESAIDSLLGQVEQSSTTTGLGILGFVTLVVAALFVFWAVQDAFDEVWAIPVQSGLGATIMHRLTALVVVGGGAVLIVLVLVINSVATLMQAVIPGADEVLSWLDVVFAALTSWFVLVLGVAVVFQVLTRTRIALIPLAIGAIATAALLTIGTTLLASYLRNYASTSVTGAAAGVMLTLLWFYYVAQMVLIGANFTHVLDERGRRHTDATKTLAAAVEPIE